MILEAVTPFFEEELAKNPTQTAISQLPIQNCEAEDFEAFLLFCYIGAIPSSIKGIEGLVKAATQFGARSALQKACLHLKDKLSASNCLGIAAFAQALEISEIEETASSFAIQNFGKVIETDNFLAVDSDRLINSLKEDDLEVDSEQKIYAAMVAWVKHDATEREKFLPDLLKLISWASLPRSVSSYQAFLQNTWVEVAFHFSTSSIVSLIFRKTLRLFEHYWKIWRAKRFLSNTPKSRPAFKVVDESVAR